MSLAGWAFHRERAPNGRSDLGPKSDVGSTKQLHPNCVVYFGGIYLYPPHSK